MEKIEAPFDDKQIQALERWQASGMVHPFTCEIHSNVPLNVSKDGLKCTEPNCEYRQTWALDVTTVNLSL